MHQLTTWATSLFVACALALPASAQSAAAQPHWVTRYLADPPQPWTAWHNTLKPDGPAAPPVTLAEGGRTESVIVLPAEPTGSETRAADELQHWLGQITGAEFKVVSDDQPAQARELCIGRTTRLTQLSGAALKKAGLTAADDLQPTDAALVVDGERVFLLGGERCGPLPAAMALLEEDLGMRWYGPAIRQGSWDQLTQALQAKHWADGEVRVPHQPDLQVGLVPRRIASEVAIRALGWQRSYHPWALRNRVNGGYGHWLGQECYASGSFCVHTFHRLVPPKTYFAEHPEYFALIGGQRQFENAQLCLSNPAVADAAAKTIAELLDKIPKSQHGTRNLVGVSQEDWLGDCQCEQCQAAAKQLGGYSGLQLSFVNRLAERLVPKYPWVTLTTLAYRQSKQPPSGDIKAHPQVAVRFCTDFGASFNWPYHSFEDTQIPDLAQQREWYLRWQQICPRMHLWIYPHQYRHYLAPMPSLRAVAENLRFFSQQGAESLYVQQSLGHDDGREVMRYWLWSKLLWDPDRNVDDLIQDFVWGYYGDAAPAVSAYEQLLTNQLAQHEDFSHKLNWIYPIHDEPWYQHGFIAQARAILGRAAEAASDDVTRQRVARLLAGVVYVESVQLYLQMRDGETPPDVARYAAVNDELGQLCDQLKIGSVGFFDGSRSIGQADEWLAELKEVWGRRFDQRFLPDESWGVWRFKWDPAEQGMPQKWFAPETGAAWQEVKVPAFLADTPAGNAIGYGWYRATFTLPESHTGRPVELEFDGVDEQAWVYVNGQDAGEHTLKSEFMVGQEISVAELWNQPFRVTVKPELLQVGENVLVVRIHNSALNAGIHQPVRAYLPDVAFREACDGAALTEDFAQCAVGGIPDRWNRYIQSRDHQVFGLAQVSHVFARQATLHLRDQRSHVCVWSKSDEVLPEGDHYAIQFDFRLSGERSYVAADVGALLGLKRGDRRTGEFLPLVQLNNDEQPGQPVTLLGLGQPLATDLAPKVWHRLVIRRDGATWRFYLDDELQQTVDDGPNTDLRGLAMGSFKDWQHLAQDVHYANLKVGSYARADGE